MWLRTFNGEARGLLRGRECSPITIISLSLADCIKAFPPSTKYLYLDFNRCFIWERNAYLGVHIFDCRKIEMSLVKMFEA